MATNYKQLFSIQKKLEKKILKACPSMPKTSGIYFYTRVDEDGKYCYIGKAVNLLRRSCSHLQGYQRIDLSLRKRGFYSNENESGWHLNFMLYPQNKLDEMESYWIEQYKNQGYELYNIESGGTIGKTIINERKPSRGYMDGLKQGRKNIAKTLKEILDKYLIVSIKNESKYAQNGLEKFWKIINENIGE